MFNSTKKDASRNAYQAPETTVANTIALGAKIDDDTAEVAVYNNKESKEEDSSTDLMIKKVENDMRNRRIVLDVNKECVMFKFSVYVLGVCRLDSTTQSYRCRFEVSCFTQMTRQQKLNYIADPENYEPKDQMQVYSLNTVELLERKQMTFHNQKTFIVYYDEDFKSLSIANIWWINAELSEDLELENFPFDVQHLEIPITFEMRDQNYMRNYKHKLMDEYCLFMIMDGVLNLNGWNMDEPHLEFKCIEYNNFPPKYAFLRFTVAREWKFYVKRVIIILAIISFLTNLTFIFGDGSTADRFSFISTMFLSAVAYMFVITTYLPELRYLTLLDKYTFFTFFYIFLIGVENGVIQWESFDQDHDTLNTGLFVGNYVFWFVMHIIFIIYSFKAYNAEYSKQQQIKEVVDEAAHAGNSGNPMAVFGRKGGYDECIDHNGANVYMKTNFVAGYDDLPHVRYGHS